MNNQPESTFLASARTIATRWSLVFAVAAGAIVASPIARAQAADQGSIRVTLLGTGTPIPIEARFGPATLVEAGSRKLVFDAGRGVTVRLTQAGVRLGDVSDVFLTHFHSDHLNGLPDLWMTSYIPVAFGSRTKPLKLWGPTGVANIARQMRATFSDDIRIREADEKVPEVATEIEAHEFSGAGVVFDEDGVKVTAFEVNHGEKIHPAFGYRVDYNGHSVLISGDTKYEPNILKYGAGVDLLVHEVCAVPTALEKLPNIKQVIDHHTSPEEAGKIFSQTKPKMAAYTHIVLLGDRDHPPLDASAIERATRTIYSGPLTMGEDLTRFTIGAGVKVEKWDRARGGY